MAYNLTNEKKEQWWCNFTVQKITFFIIHWKQICLERKLKKLKETKSTVLFGRI